MKYIYYSLYEFYTKIIKVQKYYPAVVNIAGVIAFLQTIVIFVLVNIFLFQSTKSKVLSYHAIVPFAIAIVLYILNENYFRKNEARIINEIKNRTMGVKVFSHLLTIVVIVTLIWGHFFNGFYQAIWDSWD